MGRLTGHFFGELIPKLVSIDGISELLKPHPSSEINLVIHILIIQFIHHVSVQYYFIHTKTTLRHY